MLEGGADIGYIQQILGNEKLETTAIYTEVSIEQLGDSELAELSNWWEAYLTRKNHTPEDAKLDAIKRTSGCLAGSDGDEFEEAVSAAGRDVADPHDW